MFIGTSHALSKGTLYFNQIELPFEQKTEKKKRNSIYDQCI